LPNVWGKLPDPLAIAFRRGYSAIAARMNCDLREGTICVAARHLRRTTVRAMRRRERLLPARTTEPPVVVGGRKLSISLKGNKYPSMVLFKVRQVEIERRMLCRRAAPGNQPGERNEGAAFSGILNASEA